MNAKKLLLGLGLAALLIAAGVLIFGSGDDGEEVSSTRYSNSEYKFSFERPSGYQVLEVSDPDSDRHSVILSRIEDGAVPEAGEGPPAITVDIFTGVESGMKEWLEENNVSNYNLRMGEARQTTVDGAGAFAYDWDGLYRGRSIAVNHRGNVILISGSYLEQSDQIYSDFDKVVESFELE